MRVQLLLKTGQVRTSDTRSVVLGEQRMQDNGYPTSVVWQTEEGAVHQADVLGVTTSGDFDLIRERLKNEKKLNTLCEVLKSIRS